MTLKEILEIYPENNWLKADGFDDCVMGIVHSFSGESILAYDYYIDFISNLLNNFCVIVSSSCTTAFMTSDILSYETLMRSSFV